MFVEWLTEGKRHRYTKKEIQDFFKKSGLVYGGHEKDMELADGKYGNEFGTWIIRGKLTDKDVAALNKAFPKYKWGIRSFIAAGKQFNKFDETIVEYELLDKTDI